MLKQKKDEVDCIVGISEIPGHVSPHKALHMDGMGLVTRYPDGELIRNLIHRNQDIPPFYFHNSSLYAFKTENLFKDPASIWGDKVLGYVMDVKYALDIDTPNDWVIAEAKMKMLTKKNYEKK